MLERDDVTEALSRIKDPVTGLSVIEARLISGITIRDTGQIGFLITVAPEEAVQKAWLQNACERAVASLPGVTAVTAVMTAEVNSGEPSIQPPASSSAASAPRVPAQWNKTPLPHVRRVIAVASGKGGVGKSTTTVNLAHALHALGRRTGILDADITGPSIPRMMGLKGSPEMKDNRILPLISHGIACMSMGLLVTEQSALVWRGPQLSKALSQLLRGVAWGTEVYPLDTLLIDMPPGTGDIHLSLAQQAPLHGAIIVTTPQAVAVADARKCIDMFRKVQVPVVGVIENMSGFTDPATGNIHAIFGTGGGRRLADECALPYLGEVPIEMELRAASDAGGKWEDPKGLYRAMAMQLC